MLDGETLPQSTLEADEAFEQTLAASTSEVASPPAPTPSEAPPASEPTQPRDAAGRFATKAPTATPEPSTSEAVVSPAETPAEPTTPEVRAPLPEWTYRADGRDWSIAGSEVGDDGTFIPKAQIAELQRRLGYGHVYEGTFRQRLQESSDREKQALERAAAAEKQSAHFWSVVDQMFEQGTLGEWLQNQNQNYPILKAEARARAAEELGKSAQARLKAYEDRQAQAQLEPQMRNAITAVVQQLGTQAGMPSDALGKLAEKLQAPAYRNALFQRATHDDPIAGVRAGEWLIDTDAIAREVQFLSQYAKAPSPTRAPVAQAAAANKAEKQAATPPPAVPARSGPAPSAVKKPPEFKTTREADEWLEAEGWL